MSNITADYHKRWAEDAEPALRRIIRDRDERIRQLEAQIAELSGLISGGPAHALIIPRWLDPDGDAA